MKYLLEEEKKLLELRETRVARLGNDCGFYVDTALKNMQAVDPSTTLRQIQKSVVSDHSFALTLEGRAAFAVFRLLLDRGVRTLYVYEFHVLPQFQRQGLGRQLMVVLKGLAEQLDLQTITLTVLKSNQNALQFYRQHGFTPVAWSPLDEDVEYNYYILALRTK